MVLWFCKAEVVNVAVQAVCYPNVNVFAHSLSVKCNLYFNNSMLLICFGVLKVMQGLITSVFLQGICGLVW